MATKQEWLLHVKEREAFGKAYVKETIELEKKLVKLPDGEISSLDDGPGSRPPTPPPPPPPPNP